MLLFHLLQINERRKVKVAHMQEQHDVEVARELRDQQLMRDKLKEQEAKEIEAKVIQDSLRVSSRSFSVIIGVKIKTCIQGWLKVKVRRL